MSEYRAYILDRDRHIKGCEPLTCADDDAAIVAAKRLVNVHDVELWQAARKVIVLAHKVDPLDAPLVQEARRLREEAIDAPAGPGRKAHLRKARQAETAAHVNDWLSSPGLRSPK